jgi:UDPglucose 6-dehydrogenase
MSRNIGIIGTGVVGSAMLRLFGSAATTYDLAPGSSRDRAAINACDIAFVCVPTPMAVDGSCDTSAVEDVVAWV